MPGAVVSNRAVALILGRSVLPVDVDPELCIKWTVFTASCFIELLLTAKCSKSDPGVSERSGTAQFSHLNGSISFIV